MDGNSTIASSSSHLEALPAEIWYHIFESLYPADAVSLPRVCRKLRALVSDNQLLYRQVYLHTLDEPQRQDVDWEKEVLDLARLQEICAAKRGHAKREKLPFVHDTITRLLKNTASQGHTVGATSTHAASRNVGILKDLFQEPDTREAFLERSFLFERVRNKHRRRVAFPNPPREDHQMSAKLHCLYGRPILSVGRLNYPTYPVACSLVYDLRRYTELTRWGPYMDDKSGRVDWEKMEAIMIVLGNNINTKRTVAKMFADVWNSPFSGSWPKSFVTPLNPPPKPPMAEDPYGITGTWYRVVCFLDYNDFFAFNFPSGDPVTNDRPRPALTAGEATRLIVMRIHVSHIEPPGPEDGQDLPVVHFHGVSRSLDDSWDDNANSDIQGTVRLTKEGEVRWTSTSIFYGQERWRSEGIQIGGPKSARGVVGTWFDRDYDPHGPAGPTAFWKASDSEDWRGSIQSLLPSDFFLAYSTLIDMEGSDPEAEMDWTIEEEDDDEDDDDLDDGSSEPISNELPDLLLDAEMDLEHVAPHNEST